MLETYVEYTAPGNLVAINLIAHGILVGSIGLDVSQPELEQIVVGLGAGGCANEPVHMRQQLVYLARLWFG